MAVGNVFSRLKDRLSRTRSLVRNNITKLFTGNIPLDEDILEQLEEILIQADVGVDVALELIEDLRKTFPASQVVTAEKVLAYLKTDLTQRLANRETVDDTTHHPHVILVVGVNGTGKTTSIGKLAHLYARENQSVMLVAGDTFRAAAVNQLKIWADRTGAQFIHNPGAKDPSSVVFDALQAAKSRGTDAVLIDTAGRIHTQKNLMEELKKIRRVVQKVIPDAPHETLLVIDATTGQNALIQAQQFSEATPVDHLFLTKLDGTAKGGIAIAINQRVSIPVKYIGIGEQVEDIQRFDPEAYVNAIFEG
ncbi:MAG: signal recognition particle-docking protein FtsY [Lentisphaeria bacterium]|nr:signal recognition particle-docking protein FtsY [Candidatus Neomarinimicrobiota bacterium]MCF7842178.1 signal recognition particle-docking protein FtsY [Lentisphaeria bacterium]